jgi:hypothetical protein
MDKPIIVTDQADLEKYIGKVITIKGVVTNSKVPMIIGVDVSSDNPDLRGQLAQATGVLIKIVVDEKDVDQFSANRGAGTFYRLKDVKTGYDAQVKSVK